MNLAKFKIVIALSFFSINTNLLKLIEFIFTLANIFSLISKTFLAENLYLNLRSNKLNIKKVS